jgi:hypothetical protein
MKIYVKKQRKSEMYKLIEFNDNKCIKTQTLRYVSTSGINVLKCRIYFTCLCILRPFMYLKHSKPAFKILVYYQPPASLFTLSQNPSWNIHRNQGKVTLLFILFNLQSYLGNPLHSSTQAIKLLVLFFIFYYFTSRRQQQGNHFTNPNAFWR